MVSVALLYAYEYAKEMVWLLHVSHDGNELASNKSIVLVRQITSWYVMFNPIWSN